MIPGTETKRRIIPQSPNHLTVVTWVQVGDQAFLLGGDLEEIGNPKGGWQVIVTSPEKPEGKAIVFKVPHHGSANGHLSDVWASMLVESPFALLTPWNRASKLPTQSDINRIVGFAEQSYATAHNSARRRKMRDPAVEKTLAEMNIRMREVESATGAVRLRNGGAAKPNEWSVSLRNKAYKLIAA